MPPEVYGALSLADKHWKLACEQTYKQRGRQYRNRAGRRKHRAKAMKLARRAELLMGSMS